MAQPSRKEKRVRNAYREVNLQRRELRQQALAMASEWKGLNDRFQSTIVALLSILAQKGGDVVVTQGTIDQVVANLPRLGWKTEPVAGEEGSFTIMMTEQPAPESTPSVESTTEVPLD